MSLYPPVPEPKVLSIEGVEKCRFQMWGEVEEEAYNFCTSHKRKKKEKKKKKNSKDRIPQSSSNLSLPGQPTAADRWNLI